MPTCPIRNRSRGVAPRRLLRDKLADLVSQVQGSLGVTPRSFRMGRFDWGPQVMALLPEFGLKVDSSIVPLTAKSASPKTSWPRPTRSASRASAGAPLLEAPLTLVPVIPGTPRAVYGLAAALPGAWGRRLLGWFRYLGAAGIQPAWFPLASMRLAAWLHRRRGGRVLTMFFHSSELQPGATRLFPHGGDGEAPGGQNPHLPQLAGQDLARGGRHPVRLVRDLPARESLRENQRMGYQIGALLQEKVHW